MTGSFLALLLVSSAWAQMTEQTMDDPSACPQNTVAVRVDRAGKYICKPKLKLRRNVFGPEKNQYDPCPDGYWWHRTREACTPVRCTEEPNAGNLTGLCPIGMHEHLSSSQDWTRPIECVVDYSPRNEERGGRNPVHGGCDLCVIKEHRPGEPRPWKFEKPGGARGARGRQETQQADVSPRDASPRGLNPLGKLQPKPAPQPAAKRPKPCGEGTYTSPSGDGKCLPCPEGAASVRRADGRVYCVGGAAEYSCPVGAGLMIVNDPKKPLACVPCIQGEESIALNGFMQCLRNDCPDGQLPVPEEGLVDSYACGTPMEGDGVDWPRILAIGRKTPARAPQCPAGEGIVLDGKAFKCQPCAEGLESVARNGARICERNASACPFGLVAAPSATPGEPAACRKCPEGSRFTTEGGSRSPRCVPDRPGAPQAETQAAKPEPKTEEPKAAEAKPEPRAEQPAQPQAQAKPEEAPERPAVEPLPEPAPPPRPEPHAQLKDERLPPPNEPPIVMPKAKPEAWNPPPEQPPKPQTVIEQGGKKKLAVPILR